MNTPYNETIEISRHEAGTKLCAVVSAFVPMHIHNHKAAHDHDQLYELGNQDLCGPLKTDVRSITIGLSILP